MLPTDLLIHKLCLLLDLGIMETCDVCHGNSIVSRPYLSSILSDLILLMGDACRVCFVNFLGVVHGTACEIL